MNHTKVLKEYYPEQLIRLEGLSKALDMPLPEVIAASVHIVSFT